MTPSKETLKPCPFCGGKAEYHTDKGPTGELYGWVGCNECDAMSHDCDVRSMQEDEIHPVEAWNQRADAQGEPVAAQDVEALVGATKALLNALDSCVDLTPNVIERARAALAKVQP